MSKSWLPKGGKSSVYRSSSGGRFVEPQDVTKLASITMKEGRGVSTGPSSVISLRDGTVIKTVRRDVLNRALGVGEFKKK